MNESFKFSFNNNNVLIFLDYQCPAH